MRLLLLVVVVVVLLLLALPLQMQPPCPSLPTGHPHHRVAHRRARVVAPHTHLHCSRLHLGCHNLAKSAAAVVVAVAAAGEAGASGTLLGVAVVGAVVGARLHWSCCWQRLLSWVGVVCQTRG